MHKTPITFQQWLECIPSESNSALKTPNQHPERARLSYLVPQVNRKPSLRTLGRDYSLQSDDCSHSSLESVLESRKADPEAVLIGLGFGPPMSSQNVTRIPPRFLKPSKLLTQIDLDKFLKEQGEDEIIQQQLNSMPNSPARSMQKKS